MNSNISKVKKATVVVALILVIAAVAVMAVVLPNRTVTAVSTETELDPDALAALSRYSAYASVNDFDTEMTGTVKARVFSLPFTQTVRGKRSVKNGCVIDTAESVSTFVKAGLKKECGEGKFTVSRGEYKSGGFVYASTVEYDRNSFVSAYGQIPDGLVKYDLDNTVIGAKKLNDNTYRFTLDPVRAARYYKNEVKTLLSSKTDPEFGSIEFTLKTDGERVTEITSVENFYIDKFGGTSVVAEYTERFIYDS